MADETVTLIVDESAGGELPAGAFVQQLAALLDALAAVDLEVAGRPSVEWVVTELSRSSPAVVRLSARRRSGAHPAATEQTVERFFGVLHGLQEAPETIPSTVRRKTIDAFVALGEQVKNGVLTATVRNGSHNALVTPRLVPEAQALLAPMQFANGYVEGRLQRVNTHGDDYLMWVYPSVGPDRVKCRFPKHLVDKAGDSLDKWVRVHGRLSYPAHSMHPSLVEVTEIELLPETTPSLAGLRGTWPNATGTELSDVFVRKARDNGW